MPIAASVQALTFWGTGNGHTEEFVLPADAALRIVVKGGPIVLRVRRMNGRYVADHAQLGGQTVCLGLMAIPTSGTYVLCRRRRMGRNGPLPRSASGSHLTVSSRFGPNIAAVTATRTDDSQLNADAPSRRAGQAVDCFTLVREHDRLGHMALLMMRPGGNSWTSSLSVSLATRRSRPV